MVDNTLYYGDNLQILRERVPDAAVDLVYLDPPFSSDRVYNVFLGHMESGEAGAQLHAFEDTWTWTPETERTYFELLAGGVPLKAADALQAFHGLLGEVDLMAYLVMMTPRLVELRRVLKPTGSLYLHCDPTASHYLKLIMDAIFGPTSFRNEIVWRRTGSHGPRRAFGPIHDTLLFYSHSPAYYFKVLRRPYTLQHVESRYRPDETGQLKFISGGNVLTGSGTRNGESGEMWRGFNPTARNRHWAIPGFLAEQMSPGFEELGVLARLDALYEAGLIDISETAAWPTPRRYLKDGDGQPVPDIWAYQPGTEGDLYGTPLGIDADVQWLGPTAPERLGYPTQKPRGLLERIIQSSCPEDGVVLDPFCGCGTTVDAAQHLSRRWIGIDVSFLAVDLIQHRLEAAYGSSAVFKVAGIPTDIEGAQDLFNRSHFEFERWAVSLVDGEPKEKPGGDKGIDGVARFPLGKKGQLGRIIISVKGGEQLNPAMVRDLAGTVKGHKVEMGLLISLHEPTPGMVDVANHGGTYVWPVTENSGRTYPTIQIVSVGQLLSGQKPDLPPVLMPFLKAAANQRAIEQLSLE